MVHVIFDGLDDPPTNAHQYFPPNLMRSKILITIRNNSLASKTNAMHIMHITPLDERAAEDLLNKTISKSVSDTEPGNLVTPEEIQTRRRIILLHTHRVFGVTDMETYLIRSLGTVLLSW
jgi:hypothetical protein